MAVIQSLAIFVLAGLCEIGGGYLVWLWYKDSKPSWVGVIGGAILLGYGVVAAMQPSNFGRVYAAYGGVFIVMALLWGWKIDKITPDKYDVIGATLALIGAFIIFFAPRK